MLSEISHRLISPLNTPFLVCSDLTRKDISSSPSDADFDQDNSVRRGLEGDGGIKKAQMQHCIRVLRSVTSSAEESILQDLCDQDAISQLLGNLNLSLTFAISLNLVVTISFIYFRQRFISHLVVK